VVQGSLYFSCERGVNNKVFLPPLTTREGSGGRGCHHGRDLMRLRGEVRAVVGSLSFLIRTFPLEKGEGGMHLQGSFSEGGGGKKVVGSETQ